MTRPSPTLSRNKARRATEPAKPDEQKKARKPAYLKRKMAMSQPQDKEEQEADQVAQEVSRAPREREPGPQEDKKMISSKPVPSAQRLLRRINRMVARQVEGEEEEEALQTRLRRAKKPDEDQQAATLRRSVETEEEEEEVQTRLRRKAETADDEQQPVAARLFRKGREEQQPTLNRILLRTAAGRPQEKVCSRLWRAAESEQQQENEAAPGSAGEASDTSVQPSVEERIEQSRGMGSPLPPQVLQEMESKFGQELAAVTIHNDAEAAELCKELNARAFTVGNDIYFAPAEFAPETEAGKELLAHELTHVVQQQDSVKRKLYRSVDPADNGQPHTGDPAAAAAYQNLVTIDIPAPKAQHAAMYQAWASANRLKRPRGRRVARNTAQISNWNSSIQVTETAVRAKLTEKNIGVPNDPNGKVALSINGRERMEKTIPELTTALKIPTWDRLGSPRRFQVDHKVEYQAASQDPQVDTIANYELFDPFLNRSSGGSLMVSIRRNVQNYLSTVDPYKTRTSNPKASWADAGSWLGGHEITFEHVRGGGGGVASINVGSWSQEDIETIKPLDRAQEAPDPAKGSASTFVLTSSGGGFQLARIPHPAAQATFATPAAAATAIAGLRLGQITLNGTEGSAAAGAVIGSLQASYDLPPQWTPATPDLTLNLKSAGEYMGAPDQVPALDLDFRGLSPVHFDSVQMEAGRLMAQGALTPSVPLFNAPVMVTLTGNDLIFSLTYNSGQLNLPIPGVTIDDASVMLFYSANDGFGASGTLFFSVPNLGDGSMTVGVSRGAGLNIGGSFDFDSSLFDRARIEIWYRNNQFGGSGTIGIDSPDKIKGIRSANITASYTAGAFAAIGEVQPDIPGVQQAALSVAYSEAAGLTIGGNLQLTANPAIRSGSIDVSVNKLEEAWKVRATGTAQPAIPGVDSQLTVSYDDGAFTAEFSGSYRRGMLSGTVTVGASNRAVGADGRPSGDPLPGGALNIYGSGSATIQIAPWLQGTAGIRFDPSGEVTVSGEIGIPNNVEIFARREINKSLFSVAVQVPIVPGIVAEVGGGLTAVAGIGPGVIDRLSLGITYNPAHEENTHVTGDAHLRVPADAGLRLSVRAGIGLGITGASATGGLEIGGTLGIDGAAEAGVHIDWTPTSGLDLTANLSVHAQPSFTFDISGYVAVTALGFSVYDKRWQLASYQFGSDYRFGISLPVHYHEGEPFNISLDDVQFEVPEISPGDILSGLISRIA